MQSQNELEKAREWFPEGSTVYLILRNVSRSGMSREIGVIQMHADDDGRIIDLHPNYCVSKVLGWRMGKRDGIMVSGCGMDMGFHLVDTLSYKLYGKSNALKHRWL